MVKPAAINQFPLTLFKHSPLFLLLQKERRSRIALEWSSFTEVFGDPTSVN
ncbi:MAG: hypothetical protein ACPGJS_19770 [Flammeovirgaceae bacterium]